MSATSARAFPARVERIWVLVFLITSHPVEYTIALATEVLRSYTLRH